jgi:hypothetical protein
MHISRQSMDCDTRDRLSADVERATTVYASFRGQYRSSCAEFRGEDSTRLRAAVSNALDDLEAAKTVLREHVALHECGVLAW